MGRKMNRWIGWTVGYMDGWVGGWVSGWMNTKFWILIVDLLQTWIHVFVKKIALCHPFSRLERSREQIHVGINPTYPLIYQKAVAMDSEFISQDFSGSNRNGVNIP